MDETLTLKKKILFFCVRAVEMDAFGSSYSWRGWVELHQRHECAYLGRSELHVFLSPWTYYRVILGHRMFLYSFAVYKNNLWECIFFQFSKLNAVLNIIIIIMQEFFKKLLLNSLFLYFWFLRVPNFIINSQIQT